MRRTFCIDVDAPEGLDWLQLDDLKRRIAEAVSYLGYASFVDIIETTADLANPGDCIPEKDYWGV